MKKIPLLLTALLFLAFAYVNLNDPDPIPWVSAYTAVSILFTLAAFGRSDRRITLALAAVFLGWMSTMFPGMIDWYRMGFPTITGSMKADLPHVEVVREFLGLLIAVAALSWLFIRTPRSARMG